MSDTTDAVREARAKLKQLAARMLVRKESIEKELAELERARGEIEAELAPELAERLEAKRAELEEAERDYRATIVELADLGKLEDEAERASLRGEIDRATSSDPVVRSPVEAALDNVRAHASELEARAGMSFGGSISRELDQQIDEAKARAELAELKKKRRAEKESGEEGSEEESAGDTTSDAAGAKPKRSL
jgi:hypothetical protein